MLPEANVHSHLPLLIASRQDAGDQCGDGAVDGPPLAPPGVVPGVRRAPREVVVPPRPVQPAPLPLHPLRWQAAGVRAARVRRHAGEAHASGGGAAACRRTCARRVTCAKGYRGGRSRPRARSHTHLRIACGTHTENRLEERFHGLVVLVQLFHELAKVNGGDGLPQLQGRHTQHHHGKEVSGTRSLAACVVGWVVEVVWW